MTHLTRSLVLGCSVLALAACGPEEIASPGGGTINIDNSITNPAPAPAPTPTPTPTAPTLVTPAAGCPTISATPGLTDGGTITGPTGTYRVCQLPGTFGTSSTLPYVPGLLYAMDGQVNVGTDQGAATTNNAVTLTVEPGVIVYASGQDYLNVNRGNRLNAVGTEERPIVFTSRDNVLGLNNENSSSQWGGVIMNGRAPVTDCLGQAAVPGTVDCQRQVEGAITPPLYGGATPTDNSGTLRYVQIRYSGFVLTNNDELQSLTTGGVGSGTTFEYIQSHNSSDDGVEFFGGRINMRYLVVVGAEDDSIDTDTGVKANLQFVIAIQRPGIGNSIIEADSSNALIGDLPRQNTQIANATFVHNNAAGEPPFRIRGGTDYALINTIIVSRAGFGCIRIDDAATIQAADAAQDEVGAPIFRSVLLDCATDYLNGNGGGATAAQAEQIFTSGPNNNASFTNSLVNGYINGASENGATAADPTTLSSFFVTPTGGNYIGAVRNAENNWTQGWTCNSAAASFGDDNTGACTTLPVYN